MCSCCGNHEELSNEKVEYTVDAIKRGWWSCGSALYCPECSKTWAERNGSRPMSGERNTFCIILNQFFEAIKHAEENEE